MDFRRMALVERREEIKAAARNRLVESIALVGSVARGDYSETSDFDFVVRFEKEASLLDHRGLGLDLEDILGGRVDVIDCGALPGRALGMLDDAINL